MVIGTHSGFQKGWNVERWEGDPFDASWGHLCSCDEVGIRFSLSTASIAAQSPHMTGKKPAARAALSAFSTVINWCSTNPFWAGELFVVLVRSVPSLSSGRVRADVHCYGVFSAWRQLIWRPILVYQAYSMSLKTLLMAARVGSKISTVNPEARRTTRCRYLFLLSEVFSEPVVSWMTTSNGR